MPFTIRLNVRRNGGTAEIYASAPVSEPGYDVYLGVRDVKFHHSDLGTSLQHAQMPNNRNEDFYVDFDVNMPFAAFCKKLQESEWNDFRQYNKYTHNCARAAAFALETALGIKLKLPGKCNSNRVNDLSYLRMPGIVLMPYELFCIVKQFKENEWQQNQKIDLDILREKNQLTILKMKHEPLIRRDIENIIQQLDGSLKKNPHHAKEHKNALTLTRERLVDPESDSIKKSYFEVTAFFDNRRPSRMKRHLEEYLMLNTVIFFCATYSASALDRVMESQSPLLKNIMTCIFCFLAFMASTTVNTYYPSIRAADEHERLKTPLETDLSKAMRDLSTDVTAQTLRPRSL